VKKLICLYATFFSSLTFGGDFAFKLYAQFKSGAGSFSFSPASIETALSMTREGADGNTLQQMSLLLPEFTPFPQTGNDITLNSANALWIGNLLTVKESFKNTVIEKYDAEIRTADFANNANGERQKINFWVEEKTNEKIKELLAAGSVAPLTRLILVNAIYFKGDWLHAFDKECTEPAPFHTASGAVTNVLMMAMKPAQFNYMENETFQLIELPYKGEELSMLIVLPKHAAGLEKVEAGFSDAALQNWIQSMQSKEISVFLPKFKIETELSSLKKTLLVLGLIDAFDPHTADFSNISTENLFLSDVVHKAFVQVDEEGTEAAAATGVIVRAMAFHQPVEFRADRPFIFIIRHNETGALLFMGRVFNPA